MTAAKPPDADTAGIELTADVDPADAAPAAAAAVRGTPAGTAETLLLVGADAATAAPRLDAALRGDGYRVQAAATAAEAIRAGAALLLYDLRGGVSGLQALIDALPGSAVVALSADDGADAVRRAFLLGADDYLSAADGLAGVDPAALREPLAAARRRAARRVAERHDRDRLERLNASLARSLQQLKDDEQAGRRLQFQLLPANHLSFDGYHFSHKLWTSLYLSGDFVDYFAIDARHLGFYIADVSGHGVSSAFVTVLLKSYMNRYLELHWQGKNDGILKPAKILTRLNRNVLKSNTNKYLTMFYGIIDKSQNRLYYSNGGQYPYPLVYDGHSAQFIDCKSKPVGLFDFAEYRTHSRDLPAQFTLALASDGVLELLEPASLAQKRAQLLTTLADAGFDTDAFCARLARLTAGSELPDDATLLLIQKKP